MWRWCRSLGVLLIAAASVCAQQPKASPGQKKDQYDPNSEKVRELPFWDTDRGQSISAGFLVTQPGACNPLGSILWRVMVVESPRRLLVLGEEWQFVFTKALPLDQRYLDAIKDRRPLPNLNFKALDELKGSDAGIYLALNQAITRASRATLDMFERSGDENKHVNFANLNKNSPEYRGKVLRIQGKLIVIRKEHAPRIAKNDGVDFIYTAYIEGPTRGAPPYTVVFTELPDGLQPSDRQSALVTLDGYYLGLIRFQPDEANRKTEKDVISPYLVGKTLVVNEKNAVEKKPPEESHSYYLVMGGLGGFVLVCVCGAMALLWFRRGDRQVQSQLREVRDKNLPFSLESDEIAEPRPSRSEDEGRAF